MRVVCQDRRTIETSNRSMPTNRRQEIPTNDGTVAEDRLEEETASKLATPNLAMSEDVGQIWARRQEPESGSFCAPSKSSRRLMCGHGPRRKKTIDKRAKRAKKGRRTGSLTPATVCPCCGPCPVATTVCFGGSSSSRAGLSLSLPGRPIPYLCRASSGQCIDRRPHRTVAASYTMREGAYDGRQPQGDALR